MNGFKLLLVMAFATGCTQNPSGPGAAERRAVIVDHDGAIDDYVALLMLMGSERFRIEGVTVSYGVGHLVPALETTGRILALYDLDVPLGGYTPNHRGPNRFPEEWRQSSSELVKLGPLADISPIPASGGAVELLIRLLEESQHPVSLLATGPLTNIAAVFQENQALLSKVEELVIMGGAVHVPGNTKLQSTEVADGSAEYNFFVDPEAVEAVFSLASRGLSIRLVPLDLTNYLPLTAEFVERLAAMSADRSRLAALILNRARRSIEKGSYFFWDGAAVLAMVDPQLFRFEKLSLAVWKSGPKQGRIRPSAQGHGPIHVALGLQPQAQPFEAAAALLEGRR